MYSEACTAKKKKTSSNMLIRVVRAIAEVTQGKKEMREPLQPVQQLKTAAFRVTPLPSQSMPDRSSWKLLLRVLLSFAGVRRHDLVYAVQFRGQVICKIKAVVRVVRVVRVALVLLQRMWRLWRHRGRRGCG